PRLARHYAGGHAPAYKELLARLLLVGLGLGVGGILVSVLAGRLLLSLIYTVEYASYTGLLTLIMIAALVQYTASFLGYGMTALRSFRLQLVYAVAGAIFVTIAGFMLIPRFGLTGAAWAVAVGFAVQIPLKIASILKAWRRYRT